MKTKGFRLSNRLTLTECPQSLTLRCNVYCFLMVTALSELANYIFLTSCNLPAKKTFYLLSALFCSQCYKLTINRTYSPFFTGKTLEISFRSFRLFTT